MTINQLANTVMTAVGFEGKIEFDASKPDGTPRKLLDVNRVGNLGWTAKIQLFQGISLTYQDFLQRYSNADKCL